MLAGNAHPEFPAGPADQISVVYQATIAPQPAGTSVPVVLDNNTAKAVAGVEISGTAKDPTGKIVGSGSSHGTSPSVIEPGEWALAFIDFQSGAGLSTSDSMSLTVNASPAGTSSSTAPIQVTHAKLSGNSLVGDVQNTTGRAVTGPISVDVYCFDEASKPVFTQGGSASGSSGHLAPNATATFQVRFSDQLCPSYLVGASGHASGAA